MLPSQNSTRLQRESRRSLEEAQRESVQADDAAKKELEAKNKEIIDLKVCRHPDYLSSLRSKSV